MSILRRVDGNAGIYIYCYSEDPKLYDCQICSLHPTGSSTYLEGQWDVVKHVLQHYLQDPRTPVLEALSRLYHDC